MSGHKRDQWAESLAAKVGRAIKNLMGHARRGLAGRVHCARAGHGPEFATGPVHYEQLSFRIFFLFKC
jgi:hypothetical protein